MNPMLLPLMICVGLGLPGAFSSPEDFDVLAKELRGGSNWKERVQAAEQKIVDAEDDSLAWLA